MNMSMRWINLVRIIVMMVVMAAVAPAMTGHAQSPAPIVIIQAVDSQAYPQVVVRFTAVDAVGKSLTGLTAETLQILIDEQPASITAVEPVSTGPVDLVLAFDLSLPFEMLTALKSAAGQLVAG
jgi:hypothetical protein